jgi:hypothetical protein
VTVGKSLVAIHDWTFLLGPGFIVGVGNGLILGYLMYRSGLVPRGMALLGLVAGPVLLIGGTAALLGVIEPDSALKSLAAAPEFVWELSLGHLPHGQGLQALTHHRGHDRRHHHPVRPSRIRQLSPTERGRAHRARPPRQLEVENNHPVWVMFRWGAGSYHRFRLPKSLRGRK